MFYYAFIDSNNICTGVYAMPSEIPVASYIPITEQQYNDSNAGNENSLIGKRYDAETNTFVDVPVWTCNASEVQYGTGAVSVADALDEINETLDGLGGSSTPVDAYTKLESDERYATSDHTHTGFANASHSHTAGDVTGVVKTINGTAPDENGNVSVSVSGGGMTANEILEAVKTVDGANSGLDADTLDGMEASAFATAEHTHTGYASETHTHDGYATADHTHEGYASANDLAGKADANHTHSGYASSGHSHSEYASSSHSHTPASIGAAASSHTHTPASIGAAASSHSHSEYAASNHSHSGYASSTHTHSGYLPTSGGTVSGDLNVTGILRVNGQQSVYDSGTMVTLSTNNRKTMIAGSEIYSKVAISVSSDRRLKENIEEVSADDMTKFINGLDIKSFNYIGNDEPCIGVIAQEVTEADPEMAKCFVRQDEKGYYSVKAADLVFPLIATVQKLAKEIEELKK